MRITKLRQDNSIITIIFYYYTNNYDFIVRSKQMAMPSITVDTSRFYEQKTDHFDKIERSLSALSCERVNGVNTKISKDSSNQKPKSGVSDQLVYNTDILLLFAISVPRCVSLTHENSNLLSNRLNPNI